MFEFDRKSIPTSPGVYIYKNSKREVIYVGKAKNLRNRVSSYFMNKHENSPKTQFLVKNIDNLEFIVVDNEVESLLLENKLIKKYSPKYNISLKDDKTYAYIKITDEEIPRILTTRKITSKGDYFGPYVDGYARVRLFNLTVRIFRLITSSTYSTKSRLNYDIGIAPAPTLDDVDLEEYKKNVDEAKLFLKGKNRNKILKKLIDEMNDARDSMKYELAKEKRDQIETLESLQENQKVDLIKDYDQNVIAFVESGSQSLIQVFKISRGVISGKKEYRFENENNDLLEEFVKMFYSKNYVPREILINKEFWESEEDREVLENYLSEIRGSKANILKPQRGEKLSLINMAEKNARINFGDNDVLKEMKEKLELPKIPKIIECFDMSNLGYDYLVGGMVRFVNAQPDKDNYRKFEIKSFKGKNDDFSSMKEVVFRRYKAIKDKKSGNIDRRLKNVPNEYPDLIIIDGGKGQLSAALEALVKLRVKIPIVSLAKKDEELFLPNRELSLNFDNNSNMMLLIRKIRDSVHNYVVSYNRKKRQMRVREEFEKT